MRTRWAMTGGLLCLWLMAVAPASAGAIESGIRSMLRAADLQGTQVAVCIYDVDAGEYLAEIDADAPMIPASNMKLLTTAAALDTLGGDYSFDTTLSLASGADGQARLIVHGDGDPAFGDPMLLEQHGFDVDDLLDQWVQAVVATGQRHVAELIVDDRVFDDQFVHPEWEIDDLLQHYGAQVAGLNFYENCIDILAVPGRPGSAPTIRMYPQADFLETSNRARTGKSDQFIIHRELGTNRLRFAGTIQNQPTDPWRITIHDPPMFFGHLLAERLAREGVTVDVVRRPASQEVLPEAQPLHVVRTMLPLVLQRTNQESENMFAEALLKRIGHAHTGSPGGWSNGAAALRHALNQRLGPAAIAAQVTDGSGLARANRVTTRLLTDLLVSMYRDPEVSKIYRESLAYAGRTADGQYFATGTFAPGSRFDGLAPGVWVFGKSGYISGVSAVSGYLMLPQGPGQPPRTIAFSMLFNGFRPPKYNSHMKAIQEAIVHRIEQTLADPVQLGG